MAETYTRRRTDRRRLFREQAERLLKKPSAADPTNEGGVRDERRARSGDGRKRRETRPTNR